MIVFLLYLAISVVVSFDEISAALTSLGGLAVEVFEEEVKKEDIILNREVEGNQVKSQ